MDFVEFDVFSKNFSGNEDWESSFFGKLAEHGRWDKNEFWMLHRDLVNIAISLKDSESIDKKFCFEIVTLHSRIAGLCMSHFDKNDVFKIEGIDSEQLYEFKERLDLAVLGVFSGEILPENAFDLTNPLL